MTPSLAPDSRELNDAAPEIVRTVCAYSLTFPTEAAASQAWAAVSAWVEGWYRSTEPQLFLPPGWANGGRTAPAPDHAIDTVITSLEGSIHPLRELRWRFPDSVDPTLLWTVEVATLAAGTSVFTLLLKMASADFELVPARVQLRPPPRVIRQLVARGDAHIGVHPIAAAPIRLDPEHIPPFTTLLMEQSRRHPIILISPDVDSDDRYVVDPEIIASQVVGLASVFVLGSRWAGYALSDELGKRLSCYNGAIRIYWPRFDERADQYAHPLWMPGQIADLGGGDAFGRYLLRMLAPVASFRFVEPEAIRSFRANLDHLRVERLRGEHRRDYDRLFDEYVHIDAQARALRDQLDKAVEEIGMLKTELAKRWRPASDDSPSGNEQNSDERPEVSSVLDAVHEAQRISDHVVYLPEAFESARESPYRQADRALSALLAIEDVASAWGRQLGGGPTIGSRREAFRQRGFDYKDDISQTSEGRFRDEYLYRHDGRKLLFAPHITIGAKSPDRCLSIHMYWDEHARKVLVAHVGRHKRNTLS